MDLRYAKIIYDCRMESGMSQRQLGWESEVPPNTLCRYEQGLTIPRVDKFEAVLDACGYELKVVKKKRK